MAETGKTDTRVDEYLAKHPRWQGQLAVFREVLLAVGLDEDIKWGIPAYLCGGTNLIGFAGFKQHCALWFHQGVFLQDAAGKLTNAQEGKTQAMRQWKFAEGEAVPRELLRAYALEAIENHRAGKKLKPVARKLEVPAELEQAMRENPALREAFNSLTPGRQKEYAAHIGGAKQEKTRLSRLAKARPQILAGIGLNEKYRNC